MACDFGSLKPDLTSTTLQTIFTELYEFSTTSTAFDKSGHTIWVEIIHGPYD